MSDTKQWEGRSKGSLLGYKIFVGILNTLGLGPAYFLLRFVAFYYFCFSANNQYIRRYFREIHGYSPWKARWAVYRNNYIFGQTLLDKMAVMAGVKTRFGIIHQNGHYLDELAALHRGGILLSAHVGNWEVAGQKLNRLDTTFNILMYENERAKLKQYMDRVMKEKNIRIIGIRDHDMGHLVELHTAFRNNELVVMHGDRYREGTKTLTAKFFGRPAEFPAGPFILAAKFGVPLCIVFAMKQSRNTYVFSTTEPIQVPRTRDGAQLEAVCKTLLERYVTELEAILKQYPHQWFNYYDFWK